MRAQKRTLAASAATRLRRSSLLSPLHCARTCSDDATNHRRHQGRVERRRQLAIARAASPGAQRVSVPLVLAGRSSSHRRSRAGTRLTNATFRSPPSRWPASWRRRCFSKSGTTEKGLWRAYRAAYRDEPFVRVVKDKTGIYRYPDPKILSGSNYADVGFEQMRQTTCAVSLCADRQPDERRGGRRSAGDEFDVRV